MWNCRRRRHIHTSNKDKRREVVAHLRHCHVNSCIWWVKCRTTIGLRFNRSQCFFFYEFLWTTNQLFSCLFRLWHPKIKLWVAQLTGDVQQLKEWTKDKKPSPNVRLASTVDSRFFLPPFDCLASSWAHWHHRFYVFFFIRCNYNKMKLMHKFIWNHLKSVQFSIARHGCDWDSWTDRELGNASCWSLLHFCIKFWSEWVSSRKQKLFK